MMHTIRCLLLVLGVGLASTAQAIYIIPYAENHWEMDIFVTTPAGGGVIQRRPSGSGSTTVTYADGISSLDWSFTEAAFTFAATQTRGPSSVAGVQGHVEFVVAQDTMYMISGDYSATSPSGGPVKLIASIIDSLTSTSLFSNNQISSTTIEESFVVGDTGGDESNLLTGSLTGVLLAGRPYLFNALMYLGDYRSPTIQGANGGGSVTLTFTPVPEPSTAFMLGIGLSGLARRSGARRYRCMRSTNRQRLQPRQGRTA